MVAAGADVLVFTCPAGVTTLVKDIRVSAPVGNVTGIFVYIASGAANVTVLGGTLNAGLAKSEMPWLALEPGDQLRIGVTGSSLAYFISGSLLDGVAP